MERRSLANPIAESELTGCNSDKFFPVLARQAKRARVEACADEVATVLADEPEETLARPNVKKSKTNGTPKKVVADAQAPPAPRRQPRRGVIALRPDALANIEDDTLSCSTATFDHQIRTGLKRGMASSDEEHREMVAEREAERLAVLQLEDEKDELASLLSAVGLETGSPMVDTLVPGTYRTRSSSQRGAVVAA